MPVSSSSVSFPPPILIWLILLIIITIINPIMSISGSIGHECLKDKDCQDLSILLTCGVNGRCECIDDADIKIDEEKQQCVVQEEASCYREGPDFDNKFFYVPCIKNAICSTITKTCECEERYFSIGNATCLPQKKYGEKCTYNSNITECDTFRIFNCTLASSSSGKNDGGGIGTGTCGCTNGLIYHKILDTCIRPIGASCSREYYFHNPIFPGRYDSCPLQAECYGGLCLCRPGYKISEDGNCNKDYGQRCSIDDPCSDVQFICKNQTCTCKFPLHQIYDTTSKECLSIVPGPCDDDKEAKCVPNAKCIQGQCRCEERYKQNSEGYCVKPYGYDCELDSECDSTKTHLYCINNHCSCLDLLQKFDRETEHCLGLVGSRCLLSSLDNSNSTSNQNSGSTCIEGADCKSFGSKKQYGNEGECICQKNWKKTQQGICIKNTT